MVFLVIQVITHYKVAVGWGTMPKDGRFQIQCPVGSLEIFKWPIPSVRIL